MPSQLEQEVQELREEVRRLRESQRHNGKPSEQRQKPEEPQKEEKDEKPEEPKPPLRQRAVAFIRQHPFKFLLGIVVLVALIALSVFWYLHLQSYVSTDDAQIDGHVNPVSARVAGTAMKIHVTENQMVKAGDLLVELDPRDYEVAFRRAEANLAQSEAEIRAEHPNVSITRTATATTVETAKADLANAEASAIGAEQQERAEIARLSEAEANNAKAQADLARYTMLVKRDEVSREEYDQRVAAARAAEATVRAQQAAVAASKKVIDQRQAVTEQNRAKLRQAEQSAPHEIAAQVAGVETRQAAAKASEAAVREAALNLEYTKIYAPVDGVIGRKSIEVGERVQAGQMMLSIVPLADIWVTANFKETQLKGVRAGQPATIHVDAFDRDVEGYIESLPAASAARFSILPPENASGNFVKVVQRLPVRIRFKPGQDPSHQLRPGMSVVPKVQLN